MPASFVDIDLQAETGAIPQETYSDVLILGRASDLGTGIDDPDYNRVYRYNSTTEVNNDFGSGSDVYTAASQVAAKGARRWQILMLEETSHTETVGSSDTTATNTGFVDNVPLAGGVDTVSVTVDGTDHTVEPVTDSPPSIPGDSTTTYVNFDTGEVASGTETSGTGSGIVVDYTTLSFDAALPEIESSGADVVIFANTHADRSHIGQFDRAVTFAAANRMTVLAKMQNGNRLANDQAGVDLAHDFGGYIPSPRLMTLSNKTDEDFAAVVAGQLAIHEAWFDPFADGDGYDVSADYYRESLIGDPGTPGTFEGGDSENAQGASNVLFIPSVNNRSTGTQILSNSLTTAGASSNYRYLDVKRTEDLVAVETIRGLTDLRLRRDQIPFDSEGQLLIYDAIKSALQPFIGGNNPLREPAGDEDMVYVPPFEELTEDDRANRVWSGIQIKYRLAGNVHTFDVVINATV